MKTFRDDAVRCLDRASGLGEPRIRALLEEAQPQHGEFALPCFQLAKERRMAPPAIAQEIAEKAEPEGRIAAVVATGPYVNVRVDPARLARETLDAVQAEGETYGHTREDAGKTVVVDYASPNVAKPPAFHHLRTTAIGHSLTEIYAAGAWKVVGINHLGDWGTGFGKLLLAWERYHEGDRDLEAEELNTFYVRINGEIAAEKAEGKRDLAARARQWFKRLEDGDPVARDRWQKIIDASSAEFDALFDLLGVEHDHVTGESFYEDKMGAVVQMLQEKGLLEESEGADVVHVEDDMPPCLIRKADGATLYATRDLAAAIYRQETYHFDRALYVVDRGQALHFKQFAKVLEMAGYAWADRIRHVPFGVVRMGGKKTKTREGSVVLLMDVLQEAIRKVEGLIQEKNPDLEDAHEVAKQVGVGAVVFHDLKNRRETDIDFDLDAIVSFEGNTGPYVMYSHARACSILRRADEPLAPVEAIDAARLEDESEQHLLRLVARFPDRVDQAREMDEPSEVARFLLDLCEAFHAYHSKGGRDRSLRVLTDEAALRQARLHLTNAVRQTLRNGLALLGIQAPEAM